MVGFAIGLLLSHRFILVIYVGIRCHQVAGGQQEQGEGDDRGVEQGVHYLNLSGTV